MKAPGKVSIALPTGVLMPGALRLLADWGIRPVAISGLISMSPLAMREATAHTGVECLTAQQLQAGELLHRLPEGVQPPAPAGRAGAAIGFAVRF